MENQVSDQSEGEQRSAAKTVVALGASKLQYRRHSRLLRRSTKRPQNQSSGRNIEESKKESDAQTVYPQTNRAEPKIRDAEGRFLQEVGPASGARGAVEADAVETLKLAQLEGGDARLRSLREEGDGLGEAGADGGSDGGSAEVAAAVMPVFATSGSKHLEQGALPEELARLAPEIPKEGDEASLRIVSASKASALLPTSQTATIERSEVEAARGNVEVLSFQHRGLTAAAMPASDPPLPSSFLANGPSSQIQPEKQSSKLEATAEDKVENEGEWREEHNHMNRAQSQLPQIQLGKLIKVALPKPPHQGKEFSKQASSVQQKPKGQFLSKASHSKTLMRGLHIRRAKQKEHYAEVWYDERQIPQLYEFKTNADMIEVDDTDFLLEQKDAKGEDVIQKESRIHNQSAWSTFVTVLNYIRSDIQKKQRSFTIGLYTIFLAVSFSVLMQSLLEVAPIAFLKVGQDAAGGFDFQISSDQGDPFEDGNINKYFQDPFTHKQAAASEKSFVAKVLEGSFKNNGDHAEIFGFNLLKFDEFKKKLDPLSNDSSGMFKGFSPRWTLPTQLRNIEQPALNTSALLIILDSAREVDLDLYPYFSNELLGDSEIMISKSASAHLKVSDKRKDKVEVYFDILGLFRMVQATVGHDFAESEAGKETSADEQIKLLLQKSLPSSEQIIDLLRKNFGYNITNDNILHLNVEDYLEDKDNSTVPQNYTIPTINLEDYFPDANLTEIAELNIAVNDTSSPFHGLKLTDLLDGELQVDLRQTLRKALERANFTEVQIPLDGPIGQLLKVDMIPTELTHSFTLAKSFDRPNGKFGSALGNVALVDCNYINRLFETTYAKYFEELLKEQPLFYLMFADFDIAAQSIISEMNFCNYALTIGGVMKDQIGAYTGTVQNMDDTIGYAGNLMIDRLTLDSNITISTPIVTQLEHVNLILTFMKSIMSTVVVFLAFLCTQLIYTLMLSDVEEKTFEFGMLRALGFNTKNIVVAITCQAFIFALPGLVTGIMMSAILNVIFRDILFTLTNNYSSYHLSVDSVWLGCLIGILMPLVANVIPIRNALAKNLRASLDLYHRQASEMIVTIQTLQSYGLSTVQSTISLMLVILGIVTYYLAPTAFMFANYSLFFRIMNIILLLMIIGLVFISIMFMPTLQQLVLGAFMLCCKKDRRLKTIISQNMAAHQERNTKTAIMFAICLSFLLFAGSTFILVGNLMIAVLHNQVGADFFALSIDPASMVSFIDDGPTSAYLDTQRLLDGAVLDWTYVSPNLNHIFAKIKPQKIEEAIFSDMVGYKVGVVGLHSLQENFLDVVNLKYFMLDEVSADFMRNMEENRIDIRYLRNGDIDILQTLYAELPPDDISASDRDPFDLSVHNWPQFAKSEFTETINILMPEGFRESHALDTQSTGKLCIGSLDQCQASYRVKIQAMVTKMPGLFFTGYKTSQLLFAQMAISEPQYRALLQEFFKLYSGSQDNYRDIIKSYNFTNDVPKSGMFIRLDPEITAERRSQVAEGVRSFFRDGTMFLLDLKFLLQALEASLAIFQIFVFLTGAISLVLAFFLLLISTTQNVRDNVWEYGCLRAVGLSAAQGMRSFIYEQFSIVISAIILGSLVGFVVASVVSISFGLYAEFPYMVGFPVEITAAMFVLSMATTFFAVYIPVSEIHRKAIASTLKGLAL